MTTNGLAAQVVELLEELLAQEGLSASALALRCGVEQSTISRILRGDRTPSLETLDKILSGMGLTARIEIEPK